MSSEARRFRLARGATASDVAEILGVGARRAAAAAPVHRTWYDTFDQRLREKGWQLYRVDTGGAARLTLEGPDGALLAAAACPDADLGSADSLPPPVRERLSSVIEERVLLPLVEVHSREAVLPVLDGRQKTVARVTVETRRAVRPRRTALPPVVSLSPLRGYEREADALCRVLGADTRLEPIDVDLLSELVDLAGPPPVPGLNLDFHPEIPAGVAVRAVLVRLLEIFRANLPGTIADLDIEFLHDLRVSVRRARSVTKLLGDVLPESQQQSLAAGLKWLGDQTTPTRDLDVYLHDLASPQAAGGDAVAPFRQSLQRTRSREQVAMAKALRSRNTQRLLDEWGALADLGDQGPSAGRPVGAFGAERTSKTHRRVIRDGRAVTPVSPAEALHDLRKRCKELRYLLEVFASLHGHDEHRAVVGKLKKLQDVLGSFQDSQVQSDALSHYASELMAGGEVTADTIMAMGGLAADLDRHRHGARATFQEVFDNFDSEETHRTMRELLRSMKP